MPKTRRYLAPHVSARVVLKLQLQFSATLEPFFEEYGVPVANADETAVGADAPDLSEMAAALQRHGVEIVVPG